MGGDVLLDYFKNKVIKKNLSFNIYVPIGKIKEIEKLNTKTRCIEEVYDKDENLKYYKYIDKETLYIDLYNEEEDNSYGVYIKIYVNAKDYKKYKEIKVLNTKLPIPNNLEEYLLNKYGYGYKYKEIEEQELSSNIIYDVNIPYEEYLDVLNKNNISFNKTIFYKVNRKEILEKPYIKIIDEYKDLINRTDTRFKLLKNYQNKKENILQLYKSKKFKELESVLNEYLIAIKKFYDLGLGLSFDKEIFDITIEYLKHDNQKELAKWLLKNTPKEHLKNIDFTYKKENQESLKERLDNKHIELFKKFDNFCKENEIIYYADGGTVLGAIRHNGFIPWDDDIDVFMTYDNYNKLINLLKKKNINNTKFVCFENTPNYTIYFGRLYDLSSTRIYYTDSLLNSSYGYHLDIFPVDENIDSNKRKVIWQKLFRLYGELLNPGVRMFEEDYSKYVIISNIIIKIIGRKLFLNILHKILFSNKIKSNDKYMYRWRKKIVFNKNILGKPLYVPFENIMIPIPENYEYYLEALYGESWFVYPSVNQRLPKFRVFNLDVPYHMYQDDFLGFTNIKKTINAYKNFKLLSMKKSGLLKKANSLKLKYQFYNNQITIKREIKINIINKCFNENKFGEIKKQLNNYYSLQISSECLNQNLLFIKDKKFLYNAIYALIMYGEYYKARKLLKCKKIKEILRKEESKLNKLIDEIKFIKKKSVSEKKNLFHKYPLCIPFFLEYYPLIESKIEKKKEIDKFNDTYPMAGEVMYIQALYLKEIGKGEEAKKVLNKAKINITNGLIVQRIEKEFYK